ncbi:MAG TPA: hypothetical protein VJ750_07210 [Rhizomicrobium sp.]|nr:hypothetical protein [Rhizomicrobium sp.]
MFKKIALALAAFFWVGPVSAVVPGTVASVNSIADLRTVSAANAALYPNIVVADYYGTSSGCPIQYKWNSSDSRADNGGAIINPTGNAGSGRWNLNLPPHSPIHTCVFGIIPDSPAQAGTGTDWSVQMQNLLTWASVYGPNWVHLDSVPGHCIRTTVTLVPGQGQIIEGDGVGDPNATINSGSCINFTGIPGPSGAYIIALQTPYPGAGITPYESPKFKGFTMTYFSTDTNPGGCIQLNSIAGGFTDDTTSQQPLSHPEFSNLYCFMRAVANSHKIGFQISKGADGFFDTVSTYGGLNGIDVEGSENIRIFGGRISGQVGSNIILQRRGTFGQINYVSNMQLLQPSNFGQTVDSMLYDDARESIIENNFFENFSGTTINYQIHLVAGFNAGIYNNTLTAGVTWLKVDEKYANITAYGNAAAGVDLPRAIFSKGNYHYSTSVPQILSHSGNSNSGDQGWPFNSQNGLDQTFPPKVEAIWSPNYPNLTPNGYGLKEIPVNSTFTFPTTGAADYLQFYYDRLPPPVGTFDLQIHAWQTNGTGSITCQLTDNGVLVGSPLAASLTTAPKWFTLAFNQVISTSAGVQCWDTGGSSAGNPSMVNLIELVHH